MKYTENVRRYVDKLRKNYPNRDIPTDDIIEKELCKIKCLIRTDDGSEKIIDDLLLKFAIRTWNKRYSIIIKENNNL